ncbi:hypothetical protein B1748_33300 [Paenibacillus sp. MY03]|nr:hypothetical protein B1748_33300 [Paenibacillus sp. MY03]
MRYTVCLLEMSDLKLCKTYAIKSEQNGHVDQTNQVYAELSDVIFAKSTVLDTLTELSVLIPNQSRSIPLIINQ